LYDSIIFDLDGTLWDETHVTARAWERVLENHPEAEPAIIIDSNTVGLNMGLTCEEVAKILFPTLPFEDAMRLMDESCEYENLWLAESGAVLYPKVEKTLCLLKSRGKRLFIVSNCQDGYIEAFLMGHGFADLFDDFECSGRTGLTKGENIRLIISRNSLKDPVYVGDTVSDSEGAEDAGIPFIYAKYGFGEKFDRGRVEKYDASIDSFDQLDVIFQ